MAGFFKGRVCREARALRTKPSGAAMVLRVVRDRSSICSIREKEEPAVFLSGTGKMIKTFIWCRI